MQIVDYFAVLCETLMISVSDGSALKAIILFKSMRIPKQHAFLEILCSRVKLPTSLFSMERIRTLSRPRVKLTINQLWFRLWLGIKSLPESMVTQFIDGYMQHQGTCFNHACHYNTPCNLITGPCYNGTWLTTSLKRYPTNVVKPLASVWLCLYDLFVDQQCTDTNWTDKLLAFT